MAMKKMTGAKKPVAKMATTKSRGSKTAEQMGNMNQRETVRAQRGGGTVTSKRDVANAKAKDAANKKAKNGIPKLNEASASRASQRAGGSKNLSYGEMKAKPTRKSGAKALRGR